MLTLALIVCAVALVVMTMLMLGYRAEARSAVFVANQLTAACREEQAELEKVRSEKSKLSLDLMDAKHRLSEVQAKLAASQSNVSRLNDDLQAALDKAQAEEASQGPVCEYVFADGERCRVPALLHTHHIAGHGEDAKVTVVKPAVTTQIHHHVTGASAKEVEAAVAKHSGAKKKSAPTSHETL